MRDDARRRFTIGDGLILVAAAGVALVAARSRIVNSHGLGLSLWAWAGPNLTWVGMAFTLALIPIRLVRPRPGRDDLWRQPGFVACLSFAVALAIILIQIVLSDVTLYLRRPQFSLRSLFDEELSNTIYWLPNGAMMTIVATWTVLACGGRWKAERGWIDRVGCMLGVFWIVHNLLSWCSPLFL